MTIGDIMLTPVIPPGPSLVCGRSGDPAKFGADGGWKITSRPRRIAVTEWDGWQPQTLSIPIIFDGFGWDGSVEPLIAQLYGFMRDTRGTSQPPVLHLDGPIQGAGLNWILMSIDQGDELRRNDGARTRAYFTLNLVEYVPLDYAINVPPPSPAAAAVAAAPATAATAASPSGRTYTVKRGDTLAVISQRMLGNAGRWHEIADMNGIRDPRTLRVGQVLRIP